MNVDNEMFLSKQVVDTVNEIEGFVILDERSDFREAAKLLAESTALSLSEAINYLSRMIQQYEYEELCKALEKLSDLYEEAEEEPEKVLLRPPKKLLPAHHKRYIPKIRPQARSRLRK